jgi:AraC family transcriptional regulator of adaptative response/methylated-DNA-[protein]-cysteine methyltransferase
MNLTALARQLNASPFHLQRTFKAAFGVTPRQYATACRLERFKAGVQQGQDVTTALYAAGFGSPSRLCERAGQNLGMTPGAYRNGGKGMELIFSIFDTSLGWMLLAATACGVCKVAFGESEADLEALLAEEYPFALRVRDDARLENWAGAIRAYLLGAQSRLDLPLYVQGTLFQQKVWQALRQIPYGETRTYAQLAGEIGQPNAVRAAASACAANPAAVVIPCHRIVRSGGGLGGYHWGLERKKKLLEREQGKV